MKTRGRFVALVAAGSLAVAASGCAHADDGGTSSDSALTLTPDQCRQPTVGTSPRLDATGAPIPGTARTTLNGCMLARGETPVALLGRATAVLTDTAKLATLKNDAGKPRFPRFATASPATGTLQTSLVQDVDVTFDGDSAPRTRLRVTRHQQPDGTLLVSMQNLTPLATATTPPVTVAGANGIFLNARVRAESNGISFVGTTDVTLLAELDQAIPLAFLVRNLFVWLDAGLGVGPTAAEGLDAGSN